MPKQTTAKGLLQFSFPESRGQWGSQVRTWVIGAKARVLVNEVMKLITLNILYKIKSYLKLTYIDKNYLMY